MDSKATTETKQSDHVIIQLFDIFGKLDSINHKNDIIRLLQLIFLRLDSKATTTTVL